MENYPCATALNLRLGSLIKDVCQNANRMAIVYEYKYLEKCKFYRIQYIDNNETVSLAFTYGQGFYHYLLVVSY